MTIQVITLKRTLELKRLVKQTDLLNAKADSRWVTCHTLAREIAELTNRISELSQVKGA